MVSIAPPQVLQSVASATPGKYLPSKSRYLTADGTLALTKSFDSGDSYEPVRAWRALRNQELQFELSEAQKMARLRSGARGKDARDFLVSFEKKVEDYQKILEQPNEDITTEDMEQETTAAADLLASLQAELETMSAADVEAKAREVLTGLGFKEAQLSAPFTSLSGGWQMRCRLAGTLVQVSDILILDEPTNYLDLLGILWLQQHLESLKETTPDRILVLVSHDRDVINAVTSDTIILYEQKLTYFNGNVSSYDKSIRHEILYKSRMQDAQDKQRAHMEKTIANNIKVGKKTGDDGKIKQAKSRQKKLDDRMGIEVSAKGTRFKLNRDLGGYYLTSRAAIDVPERERSVNMSFPPAPDLRFPGSLVSLEKVAFLYSNRSPAIFEDVNLVVHTGDKIGILGLNGAGKSTLIKLLVDQLKPSKGTFTAHPRVKIAYYSQHAVDSLKTMQLPQQDPNAIPCALASLNQRAAELGEELTEQDSRGLLGSMGLPGRVATDIPVSRLSGGQLVRLELCRLLLARPHVLILDEPTTHLDLPTVKALTRALVEWDGTVILVSHDRYLIRCVVEGDTIEERDSDEEETSDEEDKAKGQITGSRRLVCELRAGKLVQIDSVNTWEAKLEKRLKKLGL